MHRESVYVCTYAKGTDRVTGRVRAWDVREAAQLFAFELEVEAVTPRVGPRDVEVQESHVTAKRRRPRAAAKR